MCWMKYLALNLIIQKSTIVMSMFIESTLQIYFWNISKEALLNPIVYVQVENTFVKGFSITHQFIIYVGNIL
jgi:hypothetical protein